MSLRGDSSLMKNVVQTLQDDRYIQLGVNADLNMDASKKYLKPPTYYSKISKGVVSIDYMAESSNFDVDVSAWNFSENKIESAIGFAQNSDYRKDIASLSSKFTADAVTTNIFGG